MLKISARVLCLETCTFLIQASQITLDRLRLPKAAPQNLLLNSKNDEPDEDSYRLTEPSSSQQNNGLSTSLILKIKKHMRGNNTAKTCARSEIPQSSKLRNLGLSSDRSKNNQTSSSLQFHENAPPIVYQSRGAIRSALNGKKDKALETQFRAGTNPQLQHQVL